MQIYLSYLSCLSCLQTEAGKASTASREGIFVQGIFADCDAAARSYPMSFFHCRWSLTSPTASSCSPRVPRDITGHIDLPAYDLPTLSVSPVLLGIESWRLPLVLYLGHLLTLEAFQVQRPVPFLSVWSLAQGRPLVGSCVGLKSPQL